MNCPACGSPLKETTTAKGATFLTCSKWPKCKVSGTPDVMQLFGVVHEPPGQSRKDPLPLGSFVTGLAQLRIHQAKLKRAKTAEERELVRKQALEVLK
jgi:ssDNA-binding Zn-finger/Zn-ribbon topoisomerase 1